MPILTVRMTIITIVDMIKTNIKHESKYTIDGTSTKNEHMIKTNIKHDSKYTIEGTSKTTNI